MTVATMLPLLIGAFALLPSTHVTAQQTGGAFPATFQLFENCRDCSTNQVLANTVPYGDNGCYNFGSYSVRIECSSVYSNQYTANYYGDTGCGYSIATITGYGSGCVAAGETVYSNYVNCEYPDAPNPETSTADQPADPNAATTATLVAPALSTGTPTGTNNGLAGEGSPAGFEGTAVSAANQATQYGNQVSYGQNSQLGGAIVGGKGAAPNSQATTNPSSDGISQPDGGITVPTFSPEAAAAEAYILAHPPPAISSANTGQATSSSTSAVQDKANTATSVNSNYIVSMTAAGALAAMAYLL